MRALLRLVLPLAVLLSGTALAPTAFADESTDPGTSQTPPPPDPGTATVDPGTGTGTGTTGQTDPPAQTDPPPSDPPPAPVPTPSTFMDTAPADPTSIPSGTDVPSVFTFHSDIPTATFQCRIAGPGGKRGLWESCPGGQAGRATYTKLVGGAFVWQARATIDGGVTWGTPTPEIHWRVQTCATTMTLCKVFAPDHYDVPGGARFNNPTGTVSQQRRNLTHVIRTVNSMPGYQVPSTSVCDRAHAPSTIRISLYSLVDMPVARALRAAARRCISVQILMNNHLGAANTAAIRYLQYYLGARVSDPVTGQVRPIFAHRCSYGCRGGGVLHSKFYLFDTSVSEPAATTQITKTVMVGSSNMTSNASKVQWNDLYTVRNRPTLWSQYTYMFQRMQRDKDERRTFVFNDGIYQTTFTPLTPNTADPTMTALQSIHCTGARGAGYGGRTVVSINMHAWFGVRGYALAKRVRDMYDAGCYVKVLYSFMSYSVFRKLTKSTGSRMSVRRTIFSRHGIHAYLYSHFKMVAVSGVVGADRGAHVVWTGSNNFTNDGTHFDEVTMRIASVTAYTSYVNQFAFISRTKSSSIYASYSEPVGGGRAIDTGV